MDNGQYARYLEQQRLQRIADSTRRAQAALAPQNAQAAQAAANQGSAGLAAISNVQKDQKIQDALAVATSNRAPSLSMAGSDRRNPLTKAARANSSAGTFAMSAATRGYAPSPEISRQIPVPEVDPSEDNGPVVYSRKEILGENVLNKYVNYTYNFTLSGLRRTTLATNPSIAAFEADSKAYTILKSGGKGENYGMAESSVGLSNSTTKENRALTDQAVGFIKGFNKNSPGRFDMYIDNLEIDTLLSFSGKGGPTLPLAFRFDVYEPYSINGFLEALQAAALGCGYANYSSASFLLKMNFVGYTDDGKLDDDIENSTRYFGIRITKIQLDVTAKGSKYICVGLPFNEFAFTDEINKLHQNVQIKGTTVSDILVDFLDQVAFQRATANKNAYTKETSPIGKDEYLISFSDVNSNFSALANSRVYATDLKSNNIFTFSDNQASGIANGYGSKGSKGQPTAVQSSKIVSFAANSNITDCMAAIITESEWAKNILKNIYSKIDVDTGLLEYFLIRVEVTNLDEFDLISNRFYQRFVYKVTPYKIHYTMVPGYQQEKFVFGPDMKKHFLIRKYDYIYTGNNRDILDFKINFNNSLYAGIPNAMGLSSGIKSLANAVSTEELSIHRFDGENRVGLAANLSKGPPTARNAILPTLNSYRDNLVTSGSLSAGPPSSDPYYVQSKAMYEAVVKRTYNMTEVELSILGDPVFLVMGGVSNFDPVSTNGVVGENGSLNQNYGTPYIEVTFRNPIDIGESGFLKFQDADPETGRLEFSGVFMVRKLLSKFSNGVFTQRLQLARMPQKGENRSAIGTYLKDGKLNPGAETSPSAAEGTAEGLVPAQPTMTSSDAFARITKRNNP